MILTQGEKMVWAAAFVASVTGSEQARCQMDDEERVPCAVVDACQAVLQVRMRMPNPGEPFRPSEEAMQMLRAMLGDEG